MRDTQRETSTSTVVVDGLPLTLHLLEAGLACCAVEQSAAVALMEAAEGRADAGSVSAAALHVLVVAGTVTDAMAPLLVDALGALPQPRAVLSFGACAATGGPYWDSPVVTNGVDQLIAVDVYVPGCPPTPEAFVAGLRELASGGPA